MADANGVIHPRRSDTADSLDRLGVPFNAANLARPSNVASRANCSSLLTAVEAIRFPSRLSFHAGRPGSYIPFLSLYHLFPFTSLRGGARRSLWKKLL